MGVPKYRIAGEMGVCMVGVYEGEEGQSGAWEEGEFAIGVWMGRSWLVVEGSVYICPSDVWGSWEKQGASEMHDVIHHRSLSSAAGVTFVL